MAAVGRVEARHKRSRLSIASVASFGRRAGCFSSKSRTKFSTWGLAPLPAATKPSGS
jgi:hypothetical protein